MNLPNMPVRTCSLLVPVKSHLLILLVTKSVYHSFSWFTWWLKPPRVCGAILLKWSVFPLPTSRAAWIPPSPWRHDTKTIKTNKQTNICSKGEKTQTVWYDVVYGMEYFFGFILLSKNILENDYIIGHAYYVCLKMLPCRPYVSLCMMGKV